jgi:hypothetical protein
MVEVDEMIQTRLLCENKAWIIPTLFVRKSVITRLGCGERQNFECCTYQFFKVRVPFLC